MLKYRFKQDNGSDYPDWENKKIGNILKICHGKDYKHYSIGEYPVIGTGGVITYIDHYNCDWACTLIGRKGTINKPQYWDTPFWAIDTIFYSKPKINENPKWQYYLFNTINWLKIKTGIRPSLTMEDIENVDIFVPCPEEQQKIADFLSAVDNQIDIQCQRVEAMELQKKGLLDKVFSQELRFKQDDGNDYPDWEKTTIKKVCIVNPRNTIDDEEFYYIDLESVDAGRLISENIIQKSEAPSRAKRLLSIDDVLFQSVRSYEMNHYHFKNAKAKQVVASTGFAQLRMKNGYNGFLYQLLFTKSFNSEVKKRSTGLYATINSSSLKEVPVTIPESIEEQQKIADFFTAIDNQIDIEKQRLITMETIKKGLLQQMFC